VCWIGFNEYFCFFILLLVVVVVVFVCRRRGCLFVIVSFLVDIQPLANGAF
jgi:hypothetical protein